MKCVDFALFGTLLMLLMCTISLYCLNSDMFVHLQTVCEYTKATPLLAALSGIVLNETCENMINSALGALVNICLADDEALSRISQKDFALKLTSIAHDQKGTRTAYRALLLLPHVMKARDVGIYITEAVAAFVRVKSRP